MFTYDPQNYELDICQRGALVANSNEFLPEGHNLRRERNAGSKAPSVASRALAGLSLVGIAGVWAVLFIPLSVLGLAATVITKASKSKSR